MNVAPVRIFVIGFLVLTFITLSSSCHVISPGQRGVRVTMGKVSPEPLGEGVAWTAPFGIGHVVEVSVQQHTEKLEAACFSADLQTIKIQTSVMYRTPPENVVTLYQQYSGDAFDHLITPRLLESIKQITAGYKAEELVQKREEIREKTLTNLRKSMSGLIEIVDVNLTNIDLSDQLENAIEAKMVRQQEAMAKSYELDKEKKQAEITIVQAEAEAKSVEIKGRALANSPRVVELEIAKKWDGKSPHTLVVGAGGGANVVFPVGTADEPEKK